MADILILNGPNLNLLGTREPEKYGHQTLESLVEQLKALAKNSGKGLVHYQSNHEGQIVDRIQQASKEKIKFIIFNPAAYTHTSIAIRDALLATSANFIEVHISNISARENFRHHSYLSDIAVGTICGLGTKGYELALKYALDFINNESLSEVKHGYS
jgi:3-dehydroquinate dehydratase-2